MHENVCPIKTNKKNTIKQQKQKPERQWRRAHPASRNIKYRKFHVVQLWNSVYKFWSPQLALWDKANQIKIGWEMKF